MSEYKLVLGLEIHLQPKTDTKMFCRCSADIWEKEPNSLTCPVCLGLPGALPVPNFDAVKKTQLLGLALNCKLNKNSRFDRKHYFYPDLAKGYQISQYKQPLCYEGFLKLESGNVAEIERIHLEEDVGKSFHKNGMTLVDFNKSGMPLIEIVSKPCFKTPEDAADYCKQIQNIVRWLDIGGVDMEKGQMRLEANISLRTPEMESKNELPKYKVEVKNINSFKFMEKAVYAEIKRQTEILESGQTPIQENRGFDENTGKTVPQREKEEAHDYRYFPEPDIPPMTFDDDHIKNLESSLPELPYQFVDRLNKNYEVSLDVARVMISKFGKSIIDIFEKLITEFPDSGKKVSNILVNNKDAANLKFDDLRNIVKNELSKGSDNLSGDDLSSVVSKVVDSNPSAIEDYKKGKENAVQFLVGQLMRETKGKVNPSDAINLIKQYLSQK